MKNYKKIIAFLSLLSIGLAVLTISMFATYIKNDVYATYEYKGRGNNEIRLNNYENHFLSRYLRLDTNQIDIFKNINEYHISNKRVFGKQIMATNEKLYNLIENGITEQEEENIYSQLMNLHINIMKENYIYYTKLRSICNEQQKTRLDKFFKTTMCIDHSCCDMLSFENDTPYISMN